jgi:hypothetical protein
VLFDAALCWDMGTELDVHAGVAREIAWRSAVQRRSPVRGRPADIQRQTSGRTDFEGVVLERLAYVIERDNVGQYSISQSEKHSAKR